MYTTTTEPGTIMNTTTNEPSINPNDHTTRTGLNQLQCMQLLANMALPPPRHGTSATIAICCVMSLVMFTTIMGNLLVILAIKSYSRLHMLTNVYVLSLAVADIGVAIFVMPFEIYKTAMHRKWLLGLRYCHVFYCFVIQLCLTSILNLVFLTVDRYLAICKPFNKSRNKPKTVATFVAISWALPLIVSFVPIMLNWHLIGIRDIFDCIMMLADNKICILMMNRGFALGTGITGFFVPVLVMAILNWQIYRTAKKVLNQMRPVHSARGPDYFSTRETKAARTVGIIMGCFVLCWCPFFLVCSIDPFIGNRIPINVWIVTIWMGYANSLMNPFLLYLFNQSFKHSFQRLFARYRICRCILPKSFELFTTTTMSPKSTRDASRMARLQRSLDLSTSGVALAENPPVPQPSNTIPLTKPKHTRVVRDKSTEPLTHH